jgi:imidazolonepropionase-like amidohydrolase
MGAGPAIDAATRVNAALIAREDLGRLSVGMAGDAVLLDGDPLTDPDAICNAQRPRDVIQTGRVIGH